MESVILLLLFTYPGAIVELLLSQFAEHRSYVPKREGMQATVRYFFYSTIISTCSLAFFGVVTGTVAAGLTEWISKVTEEWWIAVYLLISFSFSFLFAVFWYWLMKNVVHRLVKGYRVKKKIPYDAGYTDVWKNVVMNPGDMDLAKVVAFVQKGKDTLACGLVHSLTDDIQGAPEISLSFSDHVAFRLNKEKDIPDEERTIGDDVLTYVNPASGYQIIFRDATKFVQELEEYQRSFMSSEA